MLGTAWSLVRMPLFTGCVLQSAVVYATFLVFISLAPYVMVSALGRPATEFGFYYLFIAVGYFLGNWSVGRLMARHDLHWLVVNGVLLSAAGAVAALAFVALGLTHPLWIFVPIGVLSYGQGLALPNVTATAVSLAPQHAGVASSTIGFLQQIIGAACVQWMGLLPDRHRPADAGLLRRGVRARRGHALRVPARRGRTPPWLTPAPASPAARDPAPPRGARARQLRYGARPIPRSPAPR